MLEDEYVIGSHANATLASNFALDFAGTAPGNGTWQTNSVFSSMTLDSEACTLTLENVTVTLDDRAGGADNELQLTETPAMDRVLGEREVQSIAMESSGATSEWTGYEMYQSASPAYGAWYVPSILKQEDNHCNNGGQCQYAIWTGQVNESGGANGISQGGTLLVLSCTDTILGWKCPQTYEDWYEFYNPSAQNPLVVLPGGVSPNDLVAAESIYNSSNNRYYVEVDDVSANEFDIANSSAGFMGPPIAGEFESEDPIEAGTDSLFPVPEFSTFSPEIADPLGYTYSCGINCLLHNLNRTYESIPDVGLSDLLYKDSSPPEGEGNCYSYTCFTLTYT